MDSCDTPFPDRPVPSGGTARELHRGSPPGDDITSPGIAPKCLKGLDDLGTLPTGGEGLATTESTLCILVDTKGGRRRILVFETGDEWTLVVVMVG